MKIIRSLLTILTILLLSISIAFAGIPGITEPFDPPNYYSPTSVSIPDSAPSPFALKDLAAQGYKVHDVINSKKDIISTIKTYIDMLQNITLFDTKSNDLKHSNDTNEDIPVLFSDIQDRINYTEDINLQDIDNMLYNSSTIIASNPYKQKNISLKDKYNYLNKIYATTLSYAKNDLNSYDERKQALLKTIQSLNSIETTMQAQEKNSEIDTLRYIEEKYRQQLIYELTVLKIAKLKDTEDSTLREKITTQNILNMQVEDPYNPSDYYKENYTKPKAIGFVDFK